VLTTHYMEEAERLADRIAVIAHGRIVATGTPGSLGHRSRSSAELSFTIPDGVRLQDLPLGVGAADVAADRKVRVRSEDPLSAMFSLTRWARERNFDLPDLELRRATLEDAYLDLTTDPDA
jgi:ABC-2 type transport system ATP-binding protein